MGRKCDGAARELLRGGAWDRRRWAGLRVGLVPEVAAGRAVAAVTAGRQQAASPGPPKSSLSETSAPDLIFVWADDGALGRPHESGYWLAGRLARLSPA